MPSRPRPASSRKLILASASPRRAALLRAGGYSFRSIPSRIAERRRPAESPTAMARRLAASKARAVASRLRPSPGGPLVLAADTIVVIKGRVLGKPRNRRAAVRMLRLLSGKAHRVITGVAICEVGRGKLRSACEVTWVWFRPLSGAEIESYAAGGEPLDKAGAYAIQGGAAAFVRRLRGSRSNVVGLPLERLASMLKEARIWSAPESRPKASKA